MACRAPRKQPLRALAGPRPPTRRQTRSANGGRSELWLAPGCHARTIAMMQPDRDISESFLPAPINANAAAGPALRMRRSQKPLFIGLEMPFCLAPATAVADTLRAGINQTRGNCDSKNCPTARSANTDRKRPREAGALPAPAKHAMRRRRIRLPQRARNKSAGKRFRLRLQALARGADRESRSCQMASRIQRP